MNAPAKIRYWLLMPMMAVGPALICSDDPEECPDSCEVLSVMLDHASNADLKQAEATLRWLGAGEPHCTQLCSTTPDACLVGGHAEEPDCQLEDDIHSCLYRTKNKFGWLIDDQEDPDHEDIQVRSDEVYCYTASCFVKRSPILADMGMELHDCEELINEADP